MHLPSGTASVVDHPDGFKQTNGTGALVTPTGIPVPPAPDAVRELADACVRFVERAVGVKLDYEPETLPLLDHYLEQGRLIGVDKPETLLVLAHTTGAYLGEVVRRRHPSWWHITGDDPAAWQIELEQVYLAFSPVQIVLDALLRSGEESGDTERFELQEEDRQAVADRLAELPAVSHDEFYAPSTRLEVIDIAVDVIRARHMSDDEADIVFHPEDYDRE